MHSTRCLAGTAALLLLVLLTRSASAQQSIETGNREKDNANGSMNVAPFLLVSAWSTVKAMDLNGSNVRTIVTDYRGISAIDYHYRRGMLFYTTEDVPGVFYVLLFGQSARPMPVKERNVNRPVGLAVDWLNDKVYWTDQRRRTLEIYDISTKDTQVIFNFAEGQRPQGISIFPFADSGWFFVMVTDETATDRTSKLMRITADGNETVTMRIGLCSSITSIDHMRRKLYWADECEYNIEETELDGSSPRTVVGDLSRESFSGLSQYEQECFYTQRNTVYKTPFDSTASILYDAGSSTTLFGLKIVHPSLQPPGDDLVAIGLCEPSCGNGECIPPGFCNCSLGWRGATCTEDMNECEVNNGDCKGICENTPGSYQCNCQPGFHVDDDLKSCAETTLPPTEEETTTSPTTHTTTTELPTTISTTQEPTTASTVPPTTTEPPTPSTTKEVTTLAETEGASTAEETTTTEIVPVTNSTPTDENTTTEPDDITFPVSEEPSVDSQNAAPTSSKNLAIIIVCVVVGLLLIVAAASCLLVALYKYSLGRRGSYDVSKHQESAVHCTVHSVEQAGTQPAAVEFFSFQAVRPDSEQEPEPVRFDEAEEDQPNEEAPAPQYDVTALQIQSSELTKFRVEDTEVQQVAAESNLVNLTINVKLAVED